VEFGYKYYIWLQLGRIKLFKNTFIQAIHFILVPVLYLPTRPTNRWVSFKLFNDTQK